MPKVTEAQKRATAKYEQKNYDRILTRFPKGTKERIIATGAKSVNSFIIQCVLDALDKPEIPAQAPNSPAEALKSGKAKYLPLTPENLKEIDFASLKSNIYYQLEIGRRFGEEATHRLYNMTETEFKKLAFPPES